MAKPIARKQGVCMAFPDVCLTPAGNSQVPIPYPNIAQLSSAEGASADVLAGGIEVILADSEIASSSGGEAGSGGGVTSGTQNDKCTFTSFSSTVKANGKGIVRQLDQTSQNNGNAQGFVMAGLPTVLVGD